MANVSKQRGKWRVRWTDENGRRHSVVFSNRRDADREALVRKAEAAEIKDGLRARRPPKKNFNDLADYWLKHRASKKRSGKDDASIIRRHLRPFFGPKLLSDISVADADSFISSRAALNSKTTANLVTLLIAMLNCARDLGWLREVLRIRKPKVRFDDKDYRYLQTQGDIRRLLAAAREEEPMIHALYATALFTGLRAGELAALEWRHVDSNRRLITVEGSFRGPTKGGRTRYVPILDPLLPILREWRLKNPLAVVFPNQNGMQLGQSARAFQETLHRVLDRAGFPKTTQGKRTIRIITFHGLRHYAESLIMPSRPVSVCGFSEDLGYHAAIGSA